MLVSAWRSQPVRLVLAGCAANRQAAAQHMDTPAPVRGPVRRSATELCLRQLEEDGAVQPDDIVATCGGARFPKYCFVVSSSERRNVKPELAACVPDVDDM